MPCRDIASGQARQTASRDSSRESRKPEPEKPAPSPAAKQLSQDEIEKKTKAIMDEYLHVHDIKVIICRW